MNLSHACHNNTLIKLDIDTLLFYSNYFSDNVSLAIPETNKNQAIFQVKMFMTEPTIFKP